MDTRNYNYIFELIGTTEQFQKIFNGLGFMNSHSKNKKWKMTMHTNSIFEFLKFKWWLRFPPKKPKRTWDPEIFH